MFDYKKIEIGELIQSRVTESNIDIFRICKYFDMKENEINQMYRAKNIDTDILLKWSKLLKYDFFRIYTQHLILFSPELKDITLKNNSSLPVFRKNIYTDEIIFFILDLIRNNIKSKEEIIKDYNIPKTTLYKWLRKYNF